MKKYKLDSRFLYLFLPLLYLEIVFHFIQFKKIDLFSFFRIIFFLLFLSIIITFTCTRFKNNNVFNIVGCITVVLFSCYSFVELIFKNYMGDFYSVGTVSDGAGRIAQYVFVFLSNARPSYYLCLLAIIIYFLLKRFIKFNDKGPFQLPLIISISSLLIMIFIMNLGSGVNSIVKVYGTFSNKDLIIDKTGIIHFLFRDLSALVYKAPDTIVISEEEIEDSTPVIEEKKREINDNNWKHTIENETNDNMKTIDNFLIKKSIAQPNDKTGEFEGYNFIYFMVEALDYLSIDKDLTPTLYKMYQEGYTFFNHYTPLYSCATGESEFVSYTSIFPYINVCTPNDTAGDKFYHALPYLFKNKGYETFALHNWRDEFYERNLILPAMGFDNFYDIDDIWQDSTVMHTDGWQSDKTLIEQAIKHIDETSGRFFCNIITSVMHFPYDEPSYWGDHYLEQISEVHPDWYIDYKRYLSKCMDFDSGLKLLLDYLEENNLADNTVICIYPDHRPYWLDYDTVMSYTNWINPRNGEYGIYRSPFIIYNKNLQANVNYNYCSTLDHVPTIANLFKLDYDPRLYMGSDAYASSNTVIFPNGNWLNENGTYYATYEEFSPNENINVDETYISKINNSVQNTIKISYLIFDEKYFEKRKSICYPRYEVN